MKCSFLILCLALCVTGYAQIDTLTLNFGETYPDITDMIHSLPKTKARRLSIDFTNYTRYLAPYDPSGNALILSRRSKRLFEKAMECLNNRLPEVKVLYVLNPTGYGAYSNVSGEVRIDTLLAPIFKLNFAKLTSLTVIYLVGDDEDYIRDLPAAFYNTPVKTIHCCRLQNYKLLNLNVKRKNASVTMVNDGPEALEFYLTLVQSRL